MQAEALNPSIVEMDAPAEVSATEAPAKASFWSRAKRVALNTAKRIAKPFTFVAAKAAPAAKKVAQATKRTATKIAAVAKVLFAKVRPTTDKAVTWTKATWKRVLKPFLKVRVLAMAIVTFVIGLIVSPVATLVATAAIGAALYTLSFGIEALEASTSKAARITLRVVEIAMAVIKGLVYITAAALTIALSVLSLPFALTEVLELVLRYFDVKGAAHIASAVFFAVTGNWLWLALALLFLSRERTSAGRSLRRSVDEQPVVATRGNRRVRLPKCTACGIDDGGSRFAVHGRRGICSVCFDALVREDALEAARKGRLTIQEYDFAVEHGLTPDGDVQRAIVDATKRRYRSLLSDEINALPQKAASAADPTKVFWAETAWWHDDKGEPRTRKWLGFVAGTVVASVEYNHRAADNRYRASLVAKPGVDGKKLGGYRSLAKAQEVVADALSDEAAIVGGMLDGLREEADGYGTPDPRPTSPVEAEQLGLLPKGASGLEDVS